MSKTTIESQTSAHDGQLLRRYFAGTWQLQHVATTIEQLPYDGPTEIAFAGRSNVGKSSLLNRLTFMKKLAFTSKTPGRTQALYMFSSDNAPFYLVDMPGYGYAKVSKTLHQSWQKLLKRYLLGRRELRLVCLLIDGRHGLKANDMLLLDQLNEAGVFCQPVLTKCDNISQTMLDNQRASMQDALKKYISCSTNIIATSAKYSDSTKNGIPALQHQLLEYLGCIRDE